MVTSKPRVILIVAAESFELKYISANLNEQWIFAANGPGPVLAGEAVDRVAQDVDAIVSVGLCGALVPELGIGDIVLGSSINGVKIAVPRTTRKSVVGPIASMDRVAQTVAEKSALRQSGAIAVEMEAAAVLDRAARRGAPFYCVRAVSDTASEGFELDLNATRDKAGRFRVGRILAQAACRPLTGVPELLRLRRNSDLASRALGEFIGNCSF
jgi:adenosylhomocysteine nucleosidase